MSFRVTDALVCVILFYFVYLVIGVGAYGWVMDTAGSRSTSILQRLGCWPTVGLLANTRVVRAPDLHL